jgi:D-alanyl-D-alanine carboxypeptidase
VILGVLGVTLLAIAVVTTGSATAEPDGRVAAATGVPSPDPSAVADPAAREAAFTPPPCDHGDVFAERQEPGDWARTILDTTYMLRADFVPSDLVPVTGAGIAGRGKVRELVIEDLRALAAAAREDSVTIAVDSAYRSFDQQVAAFSSYVTGYGEEAALRTVARPGHSEHQLGTTLDFAGDLEWLAANGPGFGFVMSYPAEASPELTCYRHEAWHYRYVGRDVAARVVNSGLSLREWLWRQRS